MARKIVILIGPEYEDLEAWYPKYRLEEAGFETPLIGMGDAHYRGKHGYPARADGKVSDIDPKGLAGIVVPGGWAPDRLRRDPAVLELVRGVAENGGMVATICHGPSVLISAGILGGKKMTAFEAIRDDVVNAGAQFVDEEVVVDGNLVTSRMPSDLPAFARAMLEVLASSAS